MAQRRMIQIVLRLQKSRSYCVLKNLDENGLFVNYGNIQGLKKSILTLLKDKKFAGRIKVNNIKKAKDYE